MMFFVGFAVGALCGLLMHRWWYGIKAAEQCILDILSRSPEPMYGLDLVKQSGGVLKRGTVYVLLSRLEDSGHVVSTAWESGRKRYTVRRPDSGIAQPRVGVGQEGIE